MTHLRLSLQSKEEAGNSEHAQTAIKNLGITYQQAVPQSIADQWWFWNCEHVPAELPTWLTVLNLDPMECIGYGLSKEDAEKIRDYKGR